MLGFPTAAAMSPAGGGLCRWIVWRGLIAKICGGPCTEGQWPQSLSVDGADGGNNNNNAVNAMMSSSLDEADGIVVVLVVAR
jgi:hypothetical protein